MKIKKLVNDLKRKIVRLDIFRQASDISFWDLINRGFKRFFEYNRHFIITRFGIIIITSMLWALYQIPKYQVETLSNQYSIQNKTLTPREAFNIENEARKTLAQIFGGAAGLVLLYFAWRRLGQQDKNIEIAKKGQGAERFSRNLEHLESNMLEIRQGGIHALGQIAEEFPEDRGPISRVLCSFIRENSVADTMEMYSGEGGGVSPAYNKEARHHSEIGQCRGDVFEALRVVAGPTFNDENRDLTYGYFHNAMLPNANLSNVESRVADFEGSNLIQANFSRADLYDTHFARANLTGADFKKASLLKVRFIQAIIISTCFDDADLSSANLEKANFTDATFYDANLNNTKFSNSISVDAILQDANLENANFKGAYLINADLRGVKLRPKKNGELDISGLLAAHTLYGAQISKSLKDLLKAKKPGLFKRISGDTIDKIRCNRFFEQNY